MQRYGLTFDASILHHILREKLLSAYERIATAVQKFPPDTEITHRQGKQKEAALTRTREALYSTERGIIDKVGAALKALLDDIPLDPKYLITSARGAVEELLGKGLLPAAQRPLETEPGGGVEG